MQKIGVEKCYLVSKMYHLCQYTKAVVMCLQCLLAVCRGALPVWAQVDTLDDERWCKWKRWLNCTGRRCTNPVLVGRRSSEPIGIHWLRGKADEKQARRGKERKRCGRRVLAWKMGED